MYICFILYYYYIYIIIIIIILYIYYYSPNEAYGSKDWALRAKTANPRLVMAISAMSLVPGLTGPILKTVLF